LDNFSYLVFCEHKKKAAVVDPGFDVSLILNIIYNKNLQLLYIINTHYHSDHISKNKKLKNEFSNSKIVASKQDGQKIGVDFFVEDGDIIELGNITLKFLLTPGHTPGGICIIVDHESILTGDTLFIGDCGRCDLLGGSLSDMFESVQRIKSLSDDLIVYPGHDYGSKPFDSLGNQKQTNKVFFARNVEEFSKIP
jgi:glyoxylase-like metal-dependent hydrolase (beta-lactamase superfamily II)